MANILRTFGLTVLFFLIGGRMGPLVYPYKLFSSDSIPEILIIQVSSLGNHFTFLGPYALRNYAFFAFFFLVSYFLFKLRDTYLNIIYAIGLGIYLDVMFNGAVASRIYDSYERLLGSRPEDQTLTIAGYYFTYVAITLGLPLAVAFGLSGIQHVHWFRQLRRRNSEDMA